MSIKQQTSTNYLIDIKFTKTESQNALGRKVSGDVTFPVSILYSDVVNYFNCPLSPIPTFSGQMSKCHTLEPVLIQSIAQAAPVVDALTKTY